jgi:hypothetical protein
MNGKRFTHFFIVIFLVFSGAIVSCQKDQDIKDDTNNKADSTFTNPDNYLAVKGTLTISLPDSTYSFDATKDSIAFVNVHSGDKQYFGITAINKAHNMSFGISSAGYALSNINTQVAGSQFILKPDSKPGIQYTLTNHAKAQDFGKISLTSYKQDTVLAKGTFYTFLAKNELDTTAVKVKGTFTLKLK